MIKRISSVALSAVLAFSTIATLPCTLSADNAAQGAIVNIDAEDYLAACGNSLPTISDIKAYATAFGGSQVTDFVIGVNNKLAAYPSDVWMDYLDKYDQTTENGKAVNYKSTPSVKGAYHIYKTLNADYIDLWIDALEDVDINPWLSFAMNDVTDATKKTSHLLSDFFHSNPSLRRVHMTKSNSKYKYGLDYSNKKVRDNMLALIDEALGRYDAYGIELDFINSIWLFSNGEEYTGMKQLNDFMREVDKITAKYAAKYGHEVKVAVRVASEIQTNYDFGLDIAAWASEGLVDRVCPSSELVVDCDIPVKYWDTLLTPYGVELAPCVTTLIKLYPDFSKPGTGAQTLETLAGYSANLFTQGADKVYLADFRIADRITSADKTASVAQTDPINTPAALWNAVNVVGSMDTLMKTDRRVILTYNDLQALWRSADPQIPVLSSTTMGLMLSVGEIPEGAVATLRFSANDAVHTKGTDIPVVYVNATKCTMSGCTDGIEGGYVTTPVLSYTIPSEVYDEVHFFAEITPKAPNNASLRIQYAEIYVDVK